MQSPRKRKMGGALPPTGSNLINSSWLSYNGRVNKKKYAQLGMHAGSAQRKLDRDLLFDLVVKAGHKCFRCQLPLSRNTFSVDHKVDWLDSPDPKVLFFDLNNIAFSHLTCNKQAPRVAKLKDERSRAEHRKKYAAQYYQEKIKGRKTATKEFKSRRRIYMRDYMRKRALKSMAD